MNRALNTYTVQSEQGWEGHTTITLVLLGDGSHACSVTTARVTGNCIALVVDDVMLTFRYVPDWAGDKEGISTGTLYLPALTY